MSSTTTHNNPKNMFSFLTNAIINTNKNNSCSKYQKKPINYKPTIIYITPDVVVNNVYTEVYVYGYNFFNADSTYITLNNSISIPVSFYSSRLITFIVPQNLEIITYDLNVVNNISYSPINVSSMPQSQLAISNSVNFTVTNT